MDIVGKNTLEVMSTANWYNRWVLDYLGKKVRGNILEVGAGIGNFSKLLRRRGNVTAIDIYPDYIQKLTKHSSILAGYGNIESGKYFFNSNKRFDTLICFNVLEHIKDDAKAIRNMFKLLDSGCSLIVIVPAHQLLLSHFDREIGHFRRYNTKHLSDMLRKAGFRKITVRYINWWAAIGWFVFLKISRRKSLPKNPVGIFEKFAKYLLWPEKFIKLPFGLSVLAIAEK